MIAPDGDVAWMTADAIRRPISPPDLDHRALVVTWFDDKNGVQTVLGELVLSEWRESSKRMAVEINNDRRERGLPDNLPPFYTWVYVIEEEP